ncbi:hypothetical protein ABW19_dt0209725 [Dactylella cylindrospora]|nr:hypothetical protein ABW19_dt0209725 [Dactylella cylindrospora]
MAEPASLILGVFALAGPISKCLKTISGIFKSSDFFRKYLQNIALQYRTHSLLFRGECKRAFRGILTKAQLQEFFGENWKTCQRDRLYNGLNHDMKKYFGENFHVEIFLAIKDISDTLRALNGNMSKLRFEDLIELDTEGIRDIAKTEAGPNGNVEKIPITIKSRASRLMDEINTQIKKLRHGNQHFKMVVDQFLEEQKWKPEAAANLLEQDTYSDIPDRIEKAADVPLISVPSVIDELQQAAQRLSCTLQKANCPCHSFNLKLGVAYSPSSLKTKSETICEVQNLDYLNFDLLSVGCSQPDQCADAIPMDISGEPTHRLPLRVEFKPLSKPAARPSLPSPSELQEPSLFTENSPSAATSANKTPQGALGLPKLPGDNTPSMAEGIGGLCSWLQRQEIACQSSSENHSPGYFSIDRSILFATGEPKNDGTTTEANAKSFLYMSLLECLLLGKINLSILQKFELAYMLAVSLLLLHSSSWISHEWGSSDIILRLSTNPSDTTENWSSYVAAAFNDIKKLQNIAKSNQAPSSYKTSYVVSLGIILLEIGISRPLVSGGRENGGSGDRHFDSWMKACEEVKLHSVNRSMGPDYDRIVQICVKWIDEDELKDKNIQQKFYKEVVLGLENCLNIVKARKEKQRRKK